MGGDLFIQRVKTYMCVRMCVCVCLQTKELQCSKGPLGFQLFGLVKSRSLRLGGLTQHAGEKYETRFNEKNPQLQLFKLSTAPEHSSL